MQNGTFRGLSRSRRGYQGWQGLNQLPQPKTHVERQHTATSSLPTNRKVKTSKTTRAMGIKDSWWMKWTDFAAGHRGLLKEIILLLKVAKYIELLTLESSNCGKHIKYQANASSHTAISNFCSRCHHGQYKKVRFLHLRPFSPWNTLPAERQL